MPSIAEGLTGETMRFLMNLFGDVMEADTQKIIAGSDLTHDLRRISTTARPQSWTTLPFVNAAAVRRNAHHLRRNGHT